MHTLRNVLSIIILATLWLVVPGCADQKTESERYASATRAYEKGEYRDALIELKNILQSNPAHKDARLLLGRTSLQLGDAEAAEKEFSRAVGLGATADEHYVLSLQAKLELGKYQDIVDNFNRLYLQNEDNRQLATVHYAAALERLGDTSAAVQGYRSVIDTAVESDTIRKAYLGLGMLQRVKGEMADAAENIQKAYDYNENAPETLIAYGQLLLGKRDFKGAQKLFAKGNDIHAVSNNQRFLLTAGEVEAGLGLDDIETLKLAANRLYKIAPQHPGTNYLLARVAYFDGDNNAAYEYVQASLAKAPRYRPAQILQGTLSVERQEYSQAEEFFKRVLGAQPENIEVRKQLADVYLKMDRPEEAVALLGKSIASGTYDRQMIDIMSRASMRAENGVSSISYLEQSLAENPDDVRLQWVLAAAYVSAEQADEALALLKGGGAGIDDRRKEILKLLIATQKKDIETARAHAQKITSRWPDDSMSNNLVGSWYYLQGEFDKAGDLFALVYAKMPDDLNALTNLGRIDMRQENYAQARERYQEYLTRNPTNEAGLLAMSYVLQMEGDSDQALSFVERAHELHPTSEGPLSVLVRVHLFNKNFAKATEFAEKAVSANLRSGRALLLRGMVEMRSGKYDSALNSFVIASRLEPGSAEIIHHRARAEVAMKMYREARDSYEQLWEMDPANVGFARALVQLESQLNRSEKANTVLDQLKLRRPDDASVIELEGDLHRQANRASAAQLAYEKAYKLEPNRALALKQYRLAESSGKSGNGYLSRWLDTSPDDAAIRELLAQSMHMKGNDAQAINQYEQLLHYNPDSPLVLNNLAWLYSEQDNSEAKIKAVALSRKAYELASENPQVADTYGWLLFRTGQLDQGLSILAKAEALAREQYSPALNNIIYHHAVALYSSGDREGARSRLEDVLGKNDNFASRSDAEALLDSL